jgi:hypothetical protein
LTGSMCLCHAKAANRRYSCVATTVVVLIQGGGGGGGGGGSVGGQVATAKGAAVRRVYD